MNTEESAKTLASMCIDYLQGGISEETFKANVKLFSNSMATETRECTCTKGIECCHKCEEI